MFYTMPVFVFVGDRWKYERSDSFLGGI